MGEAQRKALSPMSPIARRVKATASAAEASPRVARLLLMTWAATAVTPAKTRPVTTKEPARANEPAFG